MTQTTKREDRRIKANLVTHGKLMAEYIDLGIPRDIASKLAYRDMQSNAAKWQTERDELVAALRAIRADAMEFNNATWCAEIASAALAKVTK